MVEPSSFNDTGIVCRITKPAALVLNEQTAQVIQTAFRHADYPDIKGEKSMNFLGKIAYGLTNIHINDLSIENTEVDFKEDDAIDIEIHNVSASFQGTLSYGYGLLLYKNHSGIFHESAFAPSLLSESRMLYFWFSDHVLNSLALAAFLDEHLALTLGGEELKEMFESEELETHHGIVQEIFQGRHRHDPSFVCAKEASLAPLSCHNDETLRHILEKIISVAGIPEVISRIEPTLTALMDSKGLYLFEIKDPEIITQKASTTLFVWSYKLP
ncbi:hypothetical protein JD844_000133 [Phrynosoma platyrhinos]|uniref:Lipid-binding serum glycoprotein N-terminal domain-containing protein n=1 Tax=Phrynosoma platyrhinos TaxID=52577 RepID=A0ABQ7SQA8_PHRPL|nr:hypothetical protein JD844_000133 [Phrynosoma platyrhinos]